MGRRRQFATLVRMHVDNVRTVERSVHFCSLYLIIPNSYTARRNTGQYQVIKGVQRGTQVN
jgi:hypothetical protein